MDVEGVELVERRGYLTLSLQLKGRDGRVLFRRTEGIRDWFLSLQSSCRDSQVEMLNKKYAIKENIFFAVMVKHHTESLDK